MNQITSLSEEIGKLQNLKELYLQGSNSFTEKERKDSRVSTKMQN